MSSMKTQWKKANLGILILITGIAGTQIWHHMQAHLSNDDAYVNANVVNVATRVTGEVKKIYVINNQLVKKSQPILDLDPIPLEIALDKARAQLKINKAEWENARLTAERTQTLYLQRAVPKQMWDTADANFKSASAALKLAKAQLAEAKMNLYFTHVIAPADGWISNFSIREGDVLIYGQPQFALIDSNQFWVDANYKETDIEKIKVGQSASIEVDMYPDHTFTGKVQSISYGAGTAFSLLPAQNATGNWVKITQRVPVKVIFENPDPQFPLRIGTSATVDIDIHSPISNPHEHNHH